MKEVLCQRCREKRASVYYKETVNGKVSELSLCADCAREMGVGGMEEELFSSFPLFSAFSQPRHREEERCPVCHLTLSQIRKNGKFGCSACYDTFSSALDMTPFVGRGYGGTRLAENPVTEKPVEKKEETKAQEDSVEALKNMLREAIQKEEYERAAALRDRIREKEGK